MCDACHTKNRDHGPHPNIWVVISNNKWKRYMMNWCKILAVVYTSCQERSQKGAMTRVDLERHGGAHWKCDFFSWNLISFTWAFDPNPKAEALAALSLDLPLLLAPNVFISHFHIPDILFGSLTHLYVNRAYGLWRVENYTRFYL